MPLWRSLENVKRAGWCQWWAQAAALLLSPPSLLGLYLLHVVALEWEVLQSFEPWMCHLGWEIFVGGRFNLMWLSAQGAVLLIASLYTTLPGYPPFLVVVKVEIHQWCIIFDHYVTEKQERISSDIILYCFSVHGASFWPLTVPRERLKTTGFKTLIVIVATGRRWSSGHCFTSYPCLQVGSLAFLRIQLENFSAM